MRHPLLVEGRPHCARQSLASTLSAPRVGETLCCDPGRHANVITPCLLTPCLNVPKVITIGDKNVTYLTFTPDKLFEVFPCVSCVFAKEVLGESILNCPTKNTLPKLLRIYYLMFSSSMTTLRSKNRLSKWNISTAFQVYFLDVQSMRMRIT